MGKVETLRIDSILGGEAPSMYFQGKGQFDKSISIDPDLPISDSTSTKEPSGILRPSKYTTFSSSAVSGNPYWILTTPKTSLVYSYNSDGEVISYTSALGSETVVGTPTSGAGNGAAYYNNYLYFSTPTNISRYGPLDGSASLTNTVWTGATLGSQTALTNTTYPSIRGSGTMPNHVMHVHVDNKLYVADFVDGQGQIHFIKTKKVTDQGDTNDGSSYGALDLPFGYMPTCMESYGNALVIGAIQTTNATLNQGKAALFFWDTVSPSFNNSIVQLHDPLVTALKMNNGILYVWSGGITTGSAVSNGYRVSAYGGGTRLEQVYFSNTGSSPLPGAVDAIGDRVVWGTFDTIQDNSDSSVTYHAVVKAYGSKNTDLSKGVFSIATVNAAGVAADGLVTSVNYAQQASFSAPGLLVGWRDASSYGIDSRATTSYGGAYFQKSFVIGNKFKINRIRIPLGATLAASQQTLNVKLRFDDLSGTSDYTTKTINSTNYSGRVAELFPEGAVGYNNFTLVLDWDEGTSVLPVHLPIEIDVEVYDVE